jgi:hypothetical protein
MWVRVNLTRMPKIGRVIGLEEIDTTTGKKVGGFDPEQKHSLGSIQARRGRLQYSGSGSGGQFPTQALQGIREMKIKP